MDRTELALNAVDLTGRGLEFGPSHAPLVTKASGARVEIVDHATRAELVDKYRLLGVPEDQLTRIEEVDHIWTGGSFLELIPEQGVYDFIVASHFIEHTVDLIRFLQDCEALLAPGGRLALVIPDKRFCFDLFQPHTTVGDAIDGAHAATEFHPPGALVDHYAYSAERGGEIAWVHDNSREVSLKYGFDEAIQAERDGLAQAEYLDTHRWKFTPASFELLIHDLALLGHHNLGVVDSSISGAHEFFVTLGRDAPARDVDRLALLNRIEDELAIVATAELARLRAEISELRASTSWRVTGPLRAISARLRRSS